MIFTYLTPGKANSHDSELVGVGKELGLNHRSSRHDEIVCIEAVWQLGFGFVVFVWIADGGVGGVECKMERMWNVDN